MLLQLPFLIFLSLNDAFDPMPIPKRLKRQYYVCGTYPNQYYSYNQCTNNNNNLNPNPNYPNYPNYNSCTNGGQLIGVGCIYSYQCTPYSLQTTQCINGCCCTVPINPVTPINSGQGFCYNGQRSSTVCSTNSGCSVGQSCVNGLCCGQTGQEYQYACGGQAALSSCVSNQCGQFICTTSNYCCECRYGQTAGTCANGCPNEYTCSSSNYCCPQCPSGRAPFGSCFNGQCAPGYTCRPGNICC